MNDKTALLNQLKIDRPPIAPPAGRSILWWGLGGGGAIAVAATGLWLVLSPGGVPVHIAVAKAVSGDGSSVAGSILDASGYVVARRSATVSGKITDKVVEVLIEEGQRVEKDEVIARLDDTNTRAALDQAQAQLAQAHANLAAAKTALADSEPIFQRSRKLVATGWISQDAFDNARASHDQAFNNLAVAERALTVAEKAVEVAQRNEDDTIVRAPFAGVVTVKAAQPGEIVSPFSTGGFTRTGIGTIVDMDSLEVEVDVSENFINRVHPQQPCTVKLNAYPDWRIPAFVVAVIPTADRSKATVKVRVGLSVKDARVLPEMGARVAFLSEAEARSGVPSPAVLVPVDAVQADGGTGVVFVLHDQTVERRAVRLGARTDEGQQVLSGLTANTRLAAGDLGRLSDGAKVRIVER